jgi:hypothetical protein
MFQLVVADEWNTYCEKKSQGWLHCFSGLVYVEDWFSYFKNRNKHTYPNIYSLLTPAVGHMSERAIRILLPQNIDYGWQPPRQKWDGFLVDHSNQAQIGSLNRSWYLAVICSLAHTQKFNCLPPLLAWYVWGIEKPWKPPSIYCFVPPPPSEYFCEKTLVAKLEIFGQDM